MQRTSSASTRNPVGSPVEAVRRMQSSSATRNSISGSHRVLAHREQISERRPYVSDPWDDIRALQRSQVRGQSIKSKAVLDVSDIDSEPQVPQNAVRASLHDLRSAVLSAIMQRELSLTQLAVACKAFGNQHGHLKSLRGQASAMARVKKEAQLIRQTIERLLYALQAQTTEVVLCIHRWQTVVVDTQGGWGAHHLQELGSSTTSGARLPPFMWQGTNYLLRLAVDSNHVLGRWGVPCEQWCGIRTPGNPCLLPTGLIEAHQHLHSDYAAVALASLPPLFPDTEIGITSSGVKGAAPFAGFLLPFSSSGTASSLNATSRQSRSRSASSSVKSSNRSPYDHRPSSGVHPGGSVASSLGSSAGAARPRFHSSTRTRTPLGEHPAAADAEGTNAAQASRAVASEPGAEQSNIDSSSLLLQGKAGGEQHVGGVGGQQISDAQGETSHQRGGDKDATGGHLHPAASHLDTADMEQLRFVHAHVLRAVGEAVDALVQAATERSAEARAQESHIAQARSLRATGSSVSRGAGSSLHSSTRQLTQRGGTPAHRPNTVSGTRPRSVGAAGPSLQDLFEHGRFTGGSEALAGGQGAGGASGSEGRLWTSPGRLRAQPPQGGSTLEADGDSIYTTSHPAMFEPLPSRHADDSGHAVSLGMAGEGEGDVLGSHILGRDAPIAVRLQELRQKLAPPPTSASPSKRRAYYLSLLGLSDALPVPYAVDAFTAHGGETSATQSARHARDAGVGGIATEVHTQAEDLSHTLDAAAASLLAAPSGSQEEEQDRAAKGMDKGQGSVPGWPNHSSPAQEPHSRKVANGGHSGQESTVGALGALEGGSGVVSPPEAPKPSAILNARGSPALAHAPSQSGQRGHAAEAEHSTPAVSKATLAEATSLAVAAPPSPSPPPRQAVLPSHAMVEAQQTGEGKGGGSQPVLDTTSKPTVQHNQAGVHAESGHAVEGDAAPSPIVSHASQASAAALVECGEVAGAGGREGGGGAGAAAVRDQASLQRSARTPKTLRATVASYSPTSSHRARAGHAELLHGPGAAEHSLAAQHGSVHAARTDTPAPTPAQAGAAAAVIQRLARFRMSKAKVAGLRRLRHLIPRAVRLAEGLTPARFQALASLLRTLPASAQDSSATSPALPYLSLHTAALRPVLLLSRAILLLVQPGSWRVDGVPLKPRVYSDGLASLKATSAIAWADNDLDGCDIPLGMSWLDVSAVLGHMHSAAHPSSSPLSSPTQGTLPKVVAALAGIPAALSPGLLADVFDAEGGAWVCERVRRLCKEVVEPSKGLLLSPPAVLSAGICLSDAAVTALPSMLSALAQGEATLNGAAATALASAADGPARQSLLLLLTWASVMTRIVELTSACAPDNFLLDSRDRLSRLVAQDNGIADVAAASRSAHTAVPRALGPLLGRVAVYVVNCDVPLRTARALAEILVANESAPLQAFAPPLSLLDVDSGFSSASRREQAGVTGAVEGGAFLSPGPGKPAAARPKSAVRASAAAYISPAAHSVSVLRSGSDGFSTSGSVVCAKRMLYRAVAAALAGRSPIIRACLSSGAVSRARTLSVLTAVLHQMQRIAGAEVRVLVIGGGFTHMMDAAGAAAPAGAQLQLQCIAMPSDPCLANVSPSVAAHDALLLHDPAALTAVRLLAPAEGDASAKVAGLNRPMSASAVLATLAHPLDDCGRSIAASVLAHDAVDSKLPTALTCAFWEAWSVTGPHVSPDAVRRHLRAQQGGTEAAVSGTGVGGSSADGERRGMRSVASTGMLSLLSAPGISAGASYTSGPDLSAAGHGMPMPPSLAKALSNDSNVRVDLSQPLSLPAAPPGLSAAHHHGQAGRDKVARVLAEEGVHEVDDGDEPLDDDNEEEAIDALREVAVFSNSMANGDAFVANAGVEAMTPTRAFNRRAQAAATAFGPRVEVGVLSTDDIQSAARLGSTVDAMSLGCLNRMALIASAIGSAGLAHTPLGAPFSMATSDIAEQGLAFAFEQNESSPRTGGVNTPGGRRAPAASSNSQQQTGSVLTLHPLDAALRATAGVSLRAAASSCVGVSMGSASGASPFEGRDPSAGLGLDRAPAGSEAAGSGWTNAGVTTAVDDPTTATSYSLSLDIAQFATRNPTDTEGVRGDVYHVAILLTALLSSAGSSSASGPGAAVGSKSTRRASIGGGFDPSVGLGQPPVVPSPGRVGGAPVGTSTSTITSAAAWELARRLLMLPPGRLSRRLAASVPVLTAHAGAVLEKVKTWFAVLHLSWSGSAVGTCPLRPAPLTRLRPGPTTAARLVGCSPGLTLLAHWCSAMLAHLACVSAQGGPAHVLPMSPPLRTTTDACAESGLAAAVSTSLAFDHVLHVSDSLLQGLSSSAEASASATPQQSSAAAAEGSKAPRGPSNGKRRASIGGAATGLAASRLSAPRAVSRESLERDFCTLLGVPSSQVAEAQLGPAPAAAGSGTPEGESAVAFVPPPSCSRGIAGILAGHDAESVAVGVAHAAAHVQAALLACMQGGYARPSCAVLHLPVKLSPPAGSDAAPEEWMSALPAVTAAAAVFHVGALPFKGGAASAGDGHSGSLLVCLLAAETKLSVEDSSISSTLASSLRSISGVSPLCVLYGGGPYLVPRWAHALARVPSDSDGTEPADVVALGRRLAVRVSFSGVVPLDARVMSQAFARPLHMLEHHVSLQYVSDPNAPTRT